MKTLRILALLLAFASPAVAQGVPTGLPNIQASAANPAAVPSLQSPTWSLAFTVGGHPPRPSSLPMLMGEDACIKAAQSFVDADYANAAVCTDHTTGATRFFE